MNPINTVIYPSSPILASSLFFLGLSTATRNACPSLLHVTYFSYHVFLDMTTLTRNIWRRFVIVNGELHVLLTKNYSSEQTKKRWAGHVTCMGREKAHTGVWWWNLGDRDLENSGVSGRIILTGIFKKWDERKDWIDLVQDRDKSRILVMR